MQAYDPKTSKEFKCKLKELAKGFHMTPSERALKVSIVFHMSIPKSSTKKFHEDAVKGIQKHIKKPDTDNLCKSTLDALTGIFWKDDSQIVELHLSKIYSDNPRIEMEMTKV